MTTDSWLNRGDRVHAEKTILPDLYGRAHVGPAVTGTVDDDDGQAHVWLRGDDGKLYPTYRNDVSPARDCKDCGEEHGARCAWLNTCQYCSRPTDNYEPTAKDAKLLDPERLCEECHAEGVRAAEREQREAMRESYGDYLRDEGRGWRAR